MLESALPFTVPLFIRQMAVERQAVERAAEAVAQVAAGNTALLTSGEPIQWVSTHIGDLSHKGLLQASIILLRRFRDTAQGRLPPLEALVAAADQLALTSLARVEKLLEKHRAFQSACSLAPLLTRMVAVVAQCCALCLRDVNDVHTILPFTHALTMLSEVLSDSVAARVEQFRPLDAARVSIAHNNFSSYQAEAGRAVSDFFAKSPDSTKAVRVLAPLPDKPSYSWRNDEFRKFWELRVAPRYDGPAPVDVLATLLLRAAGLDACLENREAVMRRLGSLDQQEAGHAAPSELDKFGAETRRCGGVRAWVTALTASGGAEPANFAATAPARPPLPLGSLGNESRSLASTGPLSARITGGGGTWTPRSRPARPFSLSGSLRSRPAYGSGDGGHLHDSVEKNSLKASQRLILGEKASPNTRHGTFYDTPLHAAATQDFRRAPIATLLLSQGAEVNAEDKHLVTPLHVAASTGHEEVARKLIQSGADVHKEDRWKSTALHKAAANGQVEVAEMLLRSGAQAGAEDEWGSTPLHRAVAKGQLAVAERLLGNGGVAVNAEDRCGDMPMHLAARSGDYALVKLLLEHGGSATMKSRMAGKTPAECAKARGHKDVMTLLEHRHHWVSPVSTAVVAVA